MSGHDSSRINPNLPDSYNPVMDERNFAAPSHHLSTAQKEQVAELAEASAGHIHGGSNVAGGQFGSGSLGSSNNGSSLADSLSATGGQQQRGHVGQYEYSENQLQDPIDRTRGSGIAGNTGHSSALSGTGHGTREAAGAGVGGGLAAAAAQQGLGSTGHGQTRGIEDQRSGGLVGDSSYNDHSRSGAGLGAGAGAAGAAGAADLTSGQRDQSGHGAGAGEQGMLAQPQHDTSLTSELERRAQKAGTHAAGFGTQGNE